MRLVEKDETENTGQTEGASFNKRDAQGEGDGQETEEVENDIEVQGGIVFSESNNITSQMECRLPMLRLVLLSATLVNQLQLVKIISFYYWHKLTWVTAKIEFGFSKF